MSSDAKPIYAARAVGNQDFGLSGKLAENLAGERVMNKDGTFNVRRTGTSSWSTINAYHTLLTISWGQFFALTITGYFVANIVFAALFVACGAGAIDGVRTESLGHWFTDCFFFSVQTLATIGYGRMVPVSHAANALVAIEALAGLLGFAFITGLLFARFSRPQAKLAYSARAVVAPYRGGQGLMFRMANRRNNELSEVAATVAMARWETTDGQRKRAFYPLKLERDKVTFLPWQWVVVHPIDESSPMWNVTEAEFKASQPEILVLTTAMDETFSQTVHSRASYTANEVVWGARFASMLDPNDRLLVRMDKIDDIERV